MRNQGDIIYPETKFFFSWLLAQTEHGGTTMKPIWRFATITEGPSHVTDTPGTSGSLRNPGRFRMMVISYPLLIA